MLAIVRLRIRQLKNDYKAILVMTGLAILLSFVFGSSTGGSYKPSLALVDLDGSDTSKELVKRIKDETTYRFKDMTYDEAKDNIEKNKLSSAIIIEKGFEEEFRMAKSPGASLMAIENGVDIMNVEFMLKSQISSMMRDYKIAFEISNVIEKNTDIKFERVFVSSLSEIEESWDYKRPINVITETAEGGLKNYDPTMHSVLGFTIMFAAFTIVFSIAAIVDDKELGTWNRMLISPISRVSIVWQNMIVTMFIGLMQVFIILFLSSVIFGVSYGNSIIAILIVVLSFVYAIASMGFFIASLVKTQMQLSVTSPIILTSFAMLGGCMWPLEIVKSKILIYMSYLVPHRWALEALEAIVSKSFLLADVGFQISILIAMGTLFIILGSIFLKRAGDNVSSK